MCCRDLENCSHYLSIGTETDFSQLIINCLKNQICLLKTLELLDEVNHVLLSAKYAINQAVFSKIVMVCSKLYCICVSTIISGVRNVYWMHVGSQKLNQKHHWKYHSAHFIWHGGWQDYPVTAEMIRETDWGTERRAAEIIGWLKIYIHLSVYLPFLIHRIPHHLQNFQTYMLNEVFTSSDYSTAL